MTGDSVYDGEVDVEVRPELGDLIDPVAGYAVRTAATLRLADLIAEGIADPVALAKAAGADQEALRRLMRYLCVRGVFAEASSGSYVLTPFSEMLRDDHPAGLRNSLDLNGFGGRFDRAVAGLLDVVRTGEPAYPKLFGRTVYEDLARHSDAGETFTTMRAIHSARFAPAVAAAVDWAGIRHVVDVGGGTGALLSEVLRQAPQLTGTVVDLPENAAAARRLLAEAGVADRAAFSCGSFFDPLPAADIYLLSNVLYNWNDTDAERIMTGCARAGGPGGRLLVVERLLEDTPDLEAVAAQDLRLLAVSGGRQRSVADFERLGRHSGARYRSARPLVDGLSLIELHLDWPCGR